MNAEGGTLDWLKLPSDVTVSILSRLGTVEILTNTQYVCSQWRNICKDPSTWTKIDMGNSWDVLDLDNRLQKLCFHAVDRSCGHLIDINLGSIGSDQLLTYIAGRSGHLKRLRLVLCHNISDEGLTSAVVKFPFLEDLEISYCPITKHALETIGSACPLLNSLKFNVRGCKRYFSECDDEALAIAQTMPKLRHLQLFGNKLTGNGLQAILDGCPLLESLDLRKCFNVRLGGNLEKRCAERVKHLRRPYDSTHDYEFEVQTHYASAISCIHLTPEDYFELLVSDLSDYED